MPSVQVCCPPDVGPGDVILIQAPNGHEVEVEVPHGVCEGEIFDVEYSAPEPPPAYSSDEEGGTDDGDGEADALKAEREEGWDDRFHTAQGWIPRAVAPFLSSPGSAKFLAERKGGVWRRLEADTSKREASMESKVLLAAEETSAQLRDKPQISKATQQMAGKLSRQARQDRLMKPCRTVTPPAEEEPVPTRSRVSRVTSADPVIGRMEQDRRDRELRQRQYEVESKTQHRFKPLIPDRSIGITQQLGSLCGVSQRTISVPAPTRVSADDPDEGAALDTDSILRKLKARLRACAYTNGKTDLRRLFEDYDRNNDGGLSLIEFSRAVRSDGKVDRGKLSHKELAEIFHLIDENQDGTVSFKEFQEFLTKKPTTTKSKASSRRQRISLDRQRGALQAHIDDLQQQKQEALLNEDYEMAARLRDEIEKMRVSVLDVQPVPGGSLNVLVTCDSTAQDQSMWPVAYSAGSDQQLSPISSSLLMDDGPDPPKNMPSQASLTIVHCAKWVAQHGDEFEDTLKKKHLGATGWGFLYEGKTRRAEFYRNRLEYEVKLLQAEQKKHSRKKPRKATSRGSSPRGNGVIVVTCPKDVGPGQVFIVQTPAGEQLRVEVPEGIEVGMKFEVAAGDDDKELTGLRPMKTKSGRRRRTKSSGQDDIDESDRAQRSFPAGYYQVLRKSVLRADFERPSEVIHILRSGERVYVTRGAKDKNGLVWAMTSRGWVVPRRDGRKVLHALHAQRRPKDKRSRDSKKASSSRSNPDDSDLGSILEAASPPASTTGSAGPYSHAHSDAEDFTDEDAEFLREEAGGGDPAAPASTVSSRGVEDDERSDTTWGTFRDDLGDDVDTVPSLPPPSSGRPPSSGGSGRRGPSRRYSVSMTQGALDSFVQQIDVPAATEEEEEAETAEDGTETLEIECPAGVGPGDVLYVTCPDGDEVEVEVPDGVGPGDIFEVSLARA